MTFELVTPNVIDAWAFGLAGVPLMTDARVTARAAFTIREETSADFAAREMLLDDAFGPARFLKTCERLRKGRLPARGLALVATDADGDLAATIRLWPILAGGRPALLLGPVAVAEHARSLGLGGAIINESLMRAAALGHGAVLLVGDAPYYARFGFQPGFTERLIMPGPVERARFLGLELTQGALKNARGRIIPVTEPKFALLRAA